MMDMELVLAPAHRPKNYRRKPKKAETLFKYFLGNEPFQLISASFSCSLLVRRFVTTQKRAFTF